MCVHVEGDGVVGGGGGGRGGLVAAPQAPPLDLFLFSSTLAPSPEDRPWQLLDWAPKVMAWLLTFDVRSPKGSLEISLVSSLVNAENKSEGQF